MPLLSSVVGFCGGLAVDSAVPWEGYIIVDMFSPPIKLNNVISKR